MEYQWPLILFTTFIAWSAGTIACQAAGALNESHASAQKVSLAVSFALLIVGGISVFFHLQHWERIFNGFGHITSGITQELIFIVVMFVVMVAYFISLRKSSDGAIPPVVCYVAIVSAVLLVAVMGHSYQMASRPAWDSVFGALSLLGGGASAGAATFALVSVASGDADASVNGNLVVWTSVAQVVVVVALVAFFAAAAAAFSAFPWYFDPTHPNEPLLSAAQYGPFYGATVLPTVIALVSSVCGVLFALWGKKTSRWKIAAAVVLACSVIALVALRCSFYGVGGLVFLY